METGKTMEQFMEEIARRESAKKDYLVPHHGMMMEGDGEHLSLNEGGTYGVFENAHEQIADKLSIPKKYYDAMAAVPGLRAYNVNAWLDKEKKTRFVRTLDGSVRAVLSERFRPMDNYMVLQAALPVLNRNDLRVISSEVTDSRMYLQCVFPRIQAEVKVGEAVQAGIILTNSEIGKASFDVERVIYILRCSNGMVSGSIMKKNHVGRRIGEDEEDYSIYRQQTIDAELRAFALKLQDVLKNALTDSAFDESLRPMRERAGMPIPERAQEQVIKNVTKSFALSQEEGKLVLKNLWTSQDSTRWGLQNAITAVAHETKNPDRQYDMEKIGYNVMALPEVEWNKLVAVA